MAREHRPRWEGMMLDNDDPRAAFPWRTRALIAEALAEELLENPLQTTIVTLKATVERLLAERGTYALALEQIRSAPLVSESSIQRYKRCVEIANLALDSVKSTAEGVVSTCMEE